MKYIKIPGTNIEISAVSYGPALAGTLIDKETSFRFLDKYVDMGGTCVDTAHVYANWLNMGEFMSERTIGEWLNARKLHGKIHVFTKGAHMDMAHMDISRVRPAEIEKDIDESRALLGEDCLSIYWLHRDDPEYPVEIIVDAMAKAVRDGKIRYWAGSNWTTTRYEAACRYARDNNMPEPVGYQNMWSLAVANPPKEGEGDHTLVLCDDDDIAYFREHNSTLFAYSSQAGGYFSKLDRYFSEAGITPTEANAFDLVPGELKNQYYNEKNLIRYVRAKEIASSRGITTNDVAVAYMTSQPFTCVPIFSTYKDEQFDATMIAADLTLSDEEIAKLV